MTDIDERPHRRAAPWAVWLVIVGVGLAPAAVADWGFTRGEITKYPIQCKVAPVNNNCKQPLFAMGTTVYRIFPDAQTVVGQIDGYDPVRFSNCAVRNTENWKCAFADGSAELGFRSGTFFQSNAEGTVTFENMYYASRWEWLSVQYGLKK